MNNREPMLIRAFFGSAGMILFIAAVAKLISSFGKARIVQSDDLVLHVAYQKLFWFAALLELLVAGICWFAKSTNLRSGAVAWLASVFLIYRFNVSQSGHPHVCECFGTLTDNIYVSEKSADTIARFLLFILFVGSYTILCRSWYLKAVWRKMDLANPS